MRVSKPQLSMLLNICSRVAHQNTSNCPDIAVGGVEAWEVTGGCIGTFMRTLDALVSKGLVRKFHRKKTRRSFGGGCSSHHPGGYTLYCLSHKGATFLFERFAKEERQKSLSKRIADRLRPYGVKPHLLRAKEQREVAELLREGS
jgi:hypothetical protein